MLSVHEQRQDVHEKAQWKHASFSTFTFMRIDLNRVAVMLALLFSCASVNGQTVELLEVRQAFQIQLLSIGLGISNEALPIEHAVAMYRVTYPMTYLGENYDATGALFLPVDDNGNPVECALSTHTYMHGTVFLRDQTPSYEGFEGELGFLMAAEGMLTMMPDYLGLGGSEDVLHPYVHAESEAEAGMALLSAVASLQGELGFGLNGEHFVSGYSQGGHASMAMAKRMQEDPDAGFPLAGAAPMSGPYDMSGTQLPMGMAEEQYSNPAYLAYTLLAWQQTYGNLFVELSEIFQEPYASGLPAMFDGETTGEMINGYLAGPTADIVHPGALEGLMAEGHPFFLAAQDNDLHQWIPQSPVQMYYCTLDEQVFYENALVAEAWMTDNGSQAVSTVNGGALNRCGCAISAIFDGTVWINGQAALCSPTAVQNVIPEHQLQLTWRSTEAGLMVEGLRIGEAWTLFGMDGRVLRSGITRSVPLRVDAPAGVSLFRANDGRFARLFQD